MRLFPLQGLALSLLLCLPLQAAPPQPVHDAAAESVQEVHQFTLANGMTLIVKPDRRSPTAVHMLWVRVGSMDEVDGATGIAHVLEHMMFKGTPNVKPGDFSRRIAALGGRENAFTSRDATAFHQQIPAHRLREVMALEADRFANNRWPDEEFLREIEVIKEERRMRVEDSPRAQLYEMAGAVMYQASPYRRPVIGWMNDIESLTPAEVRDFRARWYVPANAAVVVAGDVDVAQVREWAQALYGQIPSGAVPARKPRIEPPQTGPRRVEHRARVSQPYLALMFKVPQMQPQDLAAEALAGPSRDALALTVLAGVLDGYNGARLDRALTQGPKPLALSVGAHHGLWGRGPQSFTLDGEPAPGVANDTLAAALRAQVGEVARQGVSEAELQRVKNQWLAAETYKLDAPFSQASELGSNWLLGLPLDARQRLVRHLRSISAEDVQRVAGRYFNDDQLTQAVLVGAAPTSARELKAPAAPLR